MKIFLLIILCVLLQSCNCGCEEQQEKADDLYTSQSEFSKLSFGDTIKFRDVKQKNTIVVFKKIINDTIHYDYNTGIYNGSGEMPYNIFTNK